MDNRKFGMLIRMYRYEHGMSVNELAGKCRVTPPTIRTIEQGKRETQAKTVFKICKGMGMDYYDMCKRLGFFDNSECGIP